MTDPRDKLEGAAGRDSGRDPRHELDDQGRKSGRDPRHELGDQDRKSGRGQSSVSGHGEDGDLEQLIERVARAQPPRRAPASLQGRVFAQIAAQPWWRRGFSHWPVPARAGFLVASFGIIKLVLAGFVSVVDFVQSSDVAGVTALHGTGAAVSTTVSLGEMVFNAIPAAWLYAGAAVGFTLYAVLFGLGTFAYRTLYVQR
jgi:hypothetical protein